jgi:hypothetical protein
MERHGLANELLDKAVTQDLGFQPQNLSKRHTAALPVKSKP